jgi:nucleoside-diphosphate-sugar epimerase
MRVLVTGGTGFTGSHLVRRLLSQGHEVRVLDNQPGLFMDELTRLGAEVSLGSVTDEDLVRKLVHGCEIVQHMAAAFREVNRSKSVYWNVNVEGTRMVCQAAQEAGVRRVVYCSTQGVHGNVDNPPGDEDTPIEPEDYYQYTKYQGEVVVNQFVQEGLEAVTLRPMAIFGPGDPARFLMIYRRVAKGRFLMAGPGNALYHPLYIDNLIDSFLLAEDRAKGGGPGLSDRRCRVRDHQGPGAAHCQGPGYQGEDHPCTLLAGLLGQRPVRADLQALAHGSRRSLGGGPTGSGRTGPSRSTGPGRSWAMIPKCRWMKA